MAIWEFTEKSTENRNKILRHCEALEELGINQDEDMMTELKVEIMLREENEDYG